MKTINYILSLAIATIIFSSCEKEEFEPESKHTLTSANVDSIYYSNQNFFDSLINAKVDSLLQNKKTIVGDANGGGYLITIYSKEEECYFEYRIDWNIIEKFKITINENKLTKTCIGFYKHNENCYLMDPENPSYIYTPYI